MASPKRGGGYTMNRIATGRSGVGVQRPPWPASTRELANLGYSGRLAPERARGDLAEVMFNRESVVGDVGTQEPGVGAPH